MAFPRVKPVGWAIGEKLTSAQQNQLDIDHSNAAKSSNVPGDQDHAWVQLPIGVGVTEGNSAAAWQIFAFVLLQNDVTVVKRWVIDVSQIVPAGVTVTQVQAIANGNFLVGSAHSAKPATMPQIGFVEVDTDGSAPYSVTQSDTSADVPSYEIAHQINLTVSRTVDRLKRYYVTVDGEHSTHAINDYFAVTGLSISWTAP